MASKRLALKGLDLNKLEVGFEPPRHGTFGSNFYFTGVQILARYFGAAGPPPRCNPVSALAGF
jgi:hypothetical protein